MATQHGERSSEPTGADVPDSRRLGAPGRQEESARAEGDDSCTARDEERLPATSAGIEDPQPACHGVRFQGFELADGDAAVVGDRERDEAVLEVTSANPGVQHARRPSRLPAPDSRLAAAPHEQDGLASGADRVVEERRVDPRAGTEIARPSVPDTRAGAVAVDCQYGATVGREEDVG
ncbi:MAG TPA: hypothetical protein VH594_12570 [Trebonia sp.]|jgi:hypothetical protein